MIGESHPWDLHGEGACFGSVVEIRGCFWTRKKAGGRCMKDVLEFSEVIETGTSSYSGAL